MNVNDETFRLILDGQEVPIASSYQVRTGVFSVPASFTMKVGHSGVINDLIARYPEFTPFQLMVGDVLIQTGETDRLELVGGDGSEVNLTGRDMLKWVVDSYLDSDRTFGEKTFLELVQLCLRELGLTNAVIATDNIANRKAYFTTSVREIVTQEDLAEIDRQIAAGTITTWDGPKVTKVENGKPLRADIGTTWWEFIKGQLRRAGLFLWATRDGNFVLSKPDASQDPIYRIIRRRGKTAGDVTVIGQPKYWRDATKRYTECQVYGRAGGGKDGRGRISGRFIDQEMVEILNPNEADQADGGKRKKPMILYDKVIRTTKQAEFLAKRKIAESRREGFHLSYRLAGHMAPALAGGGYLVWQPDTVVHVYDEELGIDSPMYLESVGYSRIPHTTTDVTLLRPGDLMFAEEDLTLPAVKSPRVRQGRTEKFEWRKGPGYHNVSSAYWQQSDGTYVAATAGDFEEIPGLGRAASVPEF